MTPPFIQVTVTVPNQDLAEHLAALLLDLQLAACVQILPCQSRYRWLGKVEQADEQMCLIKSRQDLFAQLCLRIRENHPYETPEIIAAPIIDGSEGYLAWLAAELRPLPKDEL